MRQVHYEIAEALLRGAQSTVYHQFVEATLLLLSLACMPIRVLDHTCTERPCSNALCGVQ